MYLHSKKVFEEPRSISRMKIPSLHQVQNIQMRGRQLKTFWQLLKSSPKIAYIMELLWVTKTFQKSTALKAQYEDNADFYRHRLESEMREGNKAAR